MPHQRPTVGINLDVMRRLEIEQVTDIVAILEEDAPDSDA